MKNIIDAITAKLAEFDFGIYLNDIGEDFKRPSFFVYLISAKTRDINRWTYNNNILVNITYFSKLDEYSNVDRLDQLTVGEQLIKTFSTISLKVGDRYVHISDISIDYTGDNDLMLQLTFDKGEFREEEWKELNENIELMNEINVKE